MKVMNSRYKICIVQDYIMAWSEGRIINSSNYEGPDRKYSVVATNGTFDILTAGHVNILERCAELGQRLIVLVNTDESVRRYKGKHKPYITLEHRMMVIAALGCVDFVMPFEEDTPYDSIERLYLAGVGPHIHVKGGDWKKEDMPETPMIEKYGGKVVIMPFQVDISTTKIADKIIYTTPVEPFGRWLYEPDNNLFKEVSDAGRKGSKGT
ncbi:MAG: adenylyltransferase/cytidyltransferase family protein [Candidatus Thorarchaeota archaeon]|jgi:D-beta-D-heptose 7-phosphate kinase/D-beta-D-heptose 1-phosphate adenosyltransferase